MTKHTLGRLTAIGLFALMTLAGTGLRAANPAPIPLENFFANADMSAPEVSPDGKYISFLTTLGTGKLGIALMDLATGKIEPLVAASDENIKFYFWKSGDYIVYAGDIGGNESYALRSISISKRKVVPLSDSEQETSVVAAKWAQLLSGLRFDPDNILVFGKQSAKDLNVQYWKINIRTGNQRSIDPGDSKPDAHGYVSDTAGVLRARTRYDGDKTYFEVRESEQAAYFKAAEFPIHHERWAFKAFDASGDYLYLIDSSEKPTGVLRAYNIHTRQLGPELFSSPDVEIDDVIYSYDRTKLYGGTYSPDKTKHFFVDQNRANLQAQIDATLPNTFNEVISTTADEKMLVIYASSDRDPGTYYLLDLRAKPRLSGLGKHRRAINPSQMSPMEPIQFTARDGVVLHGYLTRPVSSVGTRVPLIVNPHGGPFGPRDNWRFNSEVQFLASRGYAVLQINYRGSGGYGYKFEEAGYHEWGGKMQDDLTDGVKWAVSQGYAEADRVAIYGASYGGYAALAGAVYTPDLYRCAINYVGVSDLGIIAGKGNTARASRGYDFHAHVRVGDEPEYLHDRSPVNYVDRIRIPTLHAYGRNDPRVDIRHWDRLETKLKEFHRTYEILIEDNEGHGFGNEATSMKFYGAMEAFLARYFPAN
jgi:dipeptidyl aminopeptidase/acylaminoacyl peptidase